MLTYGLNKDIKYALLESLDSSRNGELLKQMAQLHNICTMAETLVLSLPKINGLERFPADYLRMNQLNAKAAKYLLSRGRPKEILALLEPDALDLDNTPEDFVTVADEFEVIYNKYVFFVNFLNQRREIGELRNEK